MSKIIISLLLLSLLVASCAVPRGDLSTTTPQIPLIPADSVILYNAQGQLLVRVIDTDQHKVCYIYDGSYSGGLQCFELAR